MNICETKARNQILAKKRRNNRQCNGGYVGFDEVKKLNAKTNEQINVDHVQFFVFSSSSFVIVSYANSAKQVLFFIATDII
mmetsp:Transcript_8131/g.15734  ORF Transcript_8131/g.15734 Transcript_8131/m.15734 type:complete len:81 (-) Transcript_8131:601-843(-)